MSLREFRRWSYFEATVQPLPDRLADLHNAILCATVCNLVRSADSPAIQPDDFFVLKDRTPPAPRPKPVNGETTITEADRFRAALGGR
jgi:hypothetical protein